jgi:hypothetical protein
MEKVEVKKAAAAVAAVDLLQRTNVLPKNITKLM